MCQQSSKERFFLRLLLVVHGPFHVQDSRELFRAWDSEHVKDQTSRQIVQCNLFAVGKPNMSRFGRLNILKTASASEPK